VTEPATELVTWLEQRRDRVPETLWREIQQSLGEVPRRDASALDELSNATRLQMARMRERSCTERADALALLTTDAMVTYTLELAASDPSVDLDQFAGGLLRSLATDAAPTSSR
jgi:hypothetical protein